MRKKGLIALSIAFIGIGIIRDVRAASILSIGLFVGHVSEGFESFSAGEIPGSQVNRAGPVDILNGHASLRGIHPNANLNPFYIWASSGGFSLDDLTEIEGHVSAVPFDGILGLSLQTVLDRNPIARIDFQAPISEFGGYWVHAVTRTMRGPITLSIFDAEDAVIDTVEFHYDYAGLRGESQWFGWSSTIPIRAITFTGFWAGVDGIQINFIPEPTTKKTGLTAFFAFIAVFSRALPVRRARESANREFRSEACATNAAERRATEL